MSTLDFMLDMSSNILDIVNPVLSDIDINYFCYVRRYRNNKCVSLCNNLDWQKHFYEKKLYLADTYEYMHTVESYETSKRLWVANTETNQVDQEIKEFDIGNGLSLIEVKKDFIEYFHFGTNLHNVAINNYYLNHMDFFKKFVFYFTDKTYELLSENRYNKCTIELRDEINSFDCNSSSLSNRLDDEINRIFLSENSYLTRREYECLKWLAEGKSAEETGLILDISRRTVERHLDTVKLKMDCNKNTQLIAKSFLSKILLIE